MNFLSIIAIVLLIVEVIILFTLRKNRANLSGKVKWLVLIGIIIIPITALALGNYHLFETSKESESCMKCHVMAPIAHDMLDEESMTLAARHYKNGWIQSYECYSCHKDYGFQGTMKAKLDGYRHLMRYVTKTYHEPIQYRGEFKNQNCLNCHEGKEAFVSVKEHEPVLVNMQSETPNISCLNCHGRAHPERSRRTPGHPDYEKLLELPDHAQRSVEEQKAYIMSLEK
ncbi:NapC/NirT family cytochrome c [Sediminitomix flava]|uniref:Nitrate/TMAO reductase-like tetraheme cytochrome c subunit n=1 Tax=Sediminitomix flava TaxID=379075 RepID=A0A316A101_SEDFL|nr:NapC/NirT family cytochrome c [Sediminitomix flava]PWJ43337.1 nitrate/TMAO reductase-like tetraheme cytochrome c subunit [Sediminitomix flava]